MPVIANLGYGVTGTLFDPGVVAAAGFGWTVSDHTASGASISQIVSFVRSARGAGLKVLLVVVNLNCKGQGICPKYDPAALAAEVKSSVGTAGIVIEVSEPSKDGSDLDLILRVRAAWPGIMAISECDCFLPSIPDAIIDRHECNADPTTWPGRPMHLTDCTTSLTTNARGIATWAITHPDTVAILYGQDAHLDPDVLAAPKP